MFVRQEALCVDDLEAPIRSRDKGPNPIIPHFAGWGTSSPTPFLAPARGECKCDATTSSLKTFKPTLPILQSIFSSILRFLYLLSKEHNVYITVGQDAQFESGGLLAYRARLDSWFTIRN